MSDVTITVTEIVDGVSVESTPTSITVFDGVFVESGGGGGGAVDSVNGETGTVVLSAADVGAQPVDADLTSIAALSTAAFGRSLLTQADAPTARTTLGAGTSNLAIGTSSTTAKAGNYQPTATNISDATTIGKTVLTAADAAAVRTAIGAGTSSLALGTTGSTAAAGNDSRLSDARTPTAHASTHASAGSDPVTIAESQVTNLTTDLAAKAPLASPALTGTPTAPTATGGTNTTQIATTAFVTAAVSGGGGGGTVDSVTAGDATITIGGTSADPTVAVNAIAESKVTNLVTDLAAKAPLASPTLTGHPVGVTETAGNNSTRLATTAYADNAVAKQPEVLMVAVSDESTAITTGTAKVTFRMPFAMTLTAVRASLTVESSSGNPTVDINESGGTILSTKLSIDSGEKTSTTAATAAVIADGTLADDAEITVDIDTAGTGAKGLKVSLIGTRT